MLEIFLQGKYFLNINILSIRLWIDYLIFHLSGLLMGNGQLTYCIPICIRQCTQYNIHTKNRYHCIHVMQINTN